MSKVFVVNNNGADFSAARKYGELVYLSMGVLDLREFEATKAKFFNMLSDFNFKTDYLLLAGNNLFCAAATSILSDRDAPLKTLFWSRGQYNVYEL